MKVQARREGALIPALSGFGLAALLFPAAVPLAGILLGLSANVTLVLIICAYGALLLIAIIEWRRAHLQLGQARVRPQIADALTSGQGSDLDIAISFDARRVPASLRIRPAIPPEARPIEEFLALSVNNGAAAGRYRFVPTGRGELLWRRIYVEAVWPFSLFLFRTSFVLSPPLRTVVYPDAFCMERSKVASFQRLLTGREALQLSGGEGREFESLRPYAVGDDLRRVDWKRSAKTANLLVRVYRPETHQRLHVVLDCSRRMSSRVDLRLQFDHACDAAAGLSRTAQGLGDEVGLFAFHREVLLDLRAGRSARQSELIQENLAALQPAMSEADYSLVTDWGFSLSRRALIVLLTSITNPAALELFHRALMPLTRKHLVLVAALADRGLQSLAMGRAASAEDAFIIAAAHEQLDLISAGANWLKQCGIECLYSDVSELPWRLNNQYIAMKTSGRL